jgi:hypothetical protein
MEFQQIAQNIFSNSTNVIAFYVIIFLTILAFVGTFTSISPKIRHFAKQSPAILATVGIFFSFWGISIGLIGLDLNDIQNSIPKLLDGLKAKFIASLMGIFASIIVRIAQSFTIQQEIAEKSLDDKIVNLLTEIYSVLAKNASNSPEELLQGLKQSIEQLPEEFKKQSVLLETIKSSLAGEGDASVTTQLSKVRMDMRDALRDMDSSNKQRSESLNTTLNSNFGSLTQKFEDFARIVAENNSKAFIEALEKAMRDFNNNITEQFGENFKQLNQAVGELLKWQEKYKEHVEQMTTKFDIALKSIDEIQKAFSDIQKNSQNFAQVSYELSSILEKLDVQLQSFDSYLKGIRLIADNAKDSFPIIDENLNRLTEGFKKSTEKSLADINATVESISDNLVETTGRLKDTTGKLRDSMEGQRDTIEKTSDEFKEVVGVTLKSLAKETKTSIETYQESLQEVVSSQLESINSNIKQSNAVVNATIQNASAEFEKLIVDTSTALKTTTDTVSGHLTNSTNTMKTMIEEQQNTLSSTSNEFKTVVSKTLEDLSKETQASIQSYQSSLQAAVTKQLESIDDNIKQSNTVVNTTIQNTSEEFKKSIHAIAEIMSGAITNASESFKKSIQDTAKDFEEMAETIAESADIQVKTLKNVSQDVEKTIEKTLKELSEQSKLSIKEYEKHLHDVVMGQFNAVRDSVTNASREFNRLLTENTTKSTSVLEQQVQLLDKALQEELKKSIETMGKHLASLSNRFVQDYAPLADRLKEIVKIAEDQKRGR